MNETILVIDDEQSARLILSSILGKAGYQVLEAASYHQAKAFIEEQQLDLVFSDIQLDEFNGIDILRLVKKEQPTCPVVMVTGYPTLDSAIEAVRLGAYDYLAKPVHGENLLRISTNALKFKQLADKQRESQVNLEAIFRSVNDAIITVDRQLNVLAINKAAQKLCSYPDDILGKSVDSKQPCKKKCLEYLQRTLSKQQVIACEAIRCHHTDQPDQVISLTSSPLYDVQGKGYGAVLVARNDTRLHTLEKNLQQVGHFHRIVGRSAKMQIIYELIERLADVPTTVLITGESGTGKELIADALHQAGSRKGPLVTVNCAALTENLLESELFGHVKGAFTGAIKDKTGRFMAAHGGTIFLDEIGDISPQMQTRLLRVLQEKVIERVGDSRPISVDVRVVAATNRDLRSLIECGAFREDLFYRLNVVNIDLPPLRERRTDIPLLVEHLVNKLNAKLNRNILGVDAAVMDMLMTHNWPGNVRELEHCMEHAFILCRQHRIEKKHLPPELIQASPQRESEICAENEADAIRQALHKTDGNKSKAARLLGISRRTIYRKIKAYIHRA